MSMKIGDHKPYAGAQARLEAAQDAAIAARAASATANGLLATAQARWEATEYRTGGQAAELDRRRAEAMRAGTAAERAEGELAEAEMAHRAIRDEAARAMGEAARAAHAKTVRRVGAAARELMDAARAEESTRFELTRALEAAMGGQLAAPGFVSRHVAPLGIDTVDRMGRSILFDTLEGWLIQASRAGYDA